jgi:hypothetical protein
MLLHWFCLLCGLKNKGSKSLSLKTQPKPFVPSPLFSILSPTRFSLSFSPASLPLSLSFSQIQTPPAQHLAQPSRPSGLPPLFPLSLSLTDRWGPHVRPVSYLPSSPTSNARIPPMATAHRCPSPLPCYSSPQLSAINAHRRIHTPRHLAPSTSCNDCSELHRPRALMADPPSSTALPPPPLSLSTYERRIPSLPPPAPPPRPLLACTAQSHLAAGAPPGAGAPPRLSPPQEPR